MPGFLIQQGATVLCAHGGQATATVPSPAITLDGMPAIALSAPWMVAGCPLVPPPVPPCVTAQWVVGTTRVTSYGQPLVIDAGAALTAPSAAPLLPVVTQVRVAAT